MHDKGVHAIKGVTNNGSLDSCKANPVHSDTDWMRMRYFWIHLILGLFTRKRSQICSIAQAACSAINGSESDAARSRAGKSVKSPMLPNAMQTLRKKPHRLIRFNGEFLNSARNSESLSFRYSRYSMPVVDRRAENAVSRDRGAKRVKCQA